MTYEECQREATEVAAQHGVTNFEIAIDIVMKEPNRGLTAFPRTIREHEWVRVLRDVPVHAANRPNLYLIDPTRYTLPI